MRPQVKSITFSDLSDDANGIAEDQTAGGAGDLTLDGALVTDGVATMGEAQSVSLESSADLSGVEFTITGTDADARVQVEVIDGPNANTVNTTKYFKTVTQIAVDGAVGTNVEIGPLAANGGVTKTIGMDWRQSDFKAALGVVATGTSTYTVQHTFDDIQDFTSELRWFDNDGLSAKSSSDDGNIAFPVQGCRLEVTAMTSGVDELTVIQAGGK